MADRLVFAGLRGRDGYTTSPLEIPQGLAAEAVNLDLDGSGLGTKRNGSTAITTNNSFPGGGTLQGLLLHVPAGEYSTSEVFGISTDVDAIAKLPLDTTTWSAALTLKDNPDTGAGLHWQGVSFNGKFFLAYDSGADRAHVYENGGTEIRRMGLAAPGAAPTVADTGAGAYAATPRWYQQSYRRKSGSTVLAESERSASVAFTPSGGGTAARITKAATINESETHWVIWASETSTSGPFYELAEVAVGTGTYDDSTAPASYDEGTAAQRTGTFTVPTSVRYLLNDGENRLLMAGSNETGGYTSRVWFTPVLGSLGRGDDERIVNQNTGAVDDIQHWIDLEENNGGIITGLAGPLNGRPIVFKTRQIWRLIPTSDVDAPYRPECITRQVGCPSARSIKMGVDETGAPCIYFSSQEGPYRLGVNGLQYIGRDIEDLFKAQTNGTTTLIGEWHPRRRQYWLKLAYAASSPRVRFHADLGRPDGSGAIRGGWVQDINANASAGIASAVAMTAIPYSPGLSGVHLDIPRVHVVTESGAILRCDDGTTDNSVTFQAYSTTAPKAPAGAGVQVGTGAPVIAGKSASGTPTITVTQRKNYSAETREATGALSTQRAHIRCEEGGGLDECDAVAFTVGDGSASSSAWTLDALIVAWEARGALATL